MCIGLHFCCVMLQLKALLGLTRKTNNRIQQTIAHILRNLQTSGSLRTICNSRNAILIMVMETMMMMMMRVTLTRFVLTVEYPVHMNREINSKGNNLQDLCVKRGYSISVVQFEQFLQKTNSTHNYTLIVIPHKEPTVNHKLETA